MKFIQVVEGNRNILINVSDISVIQETKDKNKYRTDIFLRDDGDTVMSVDHSYEEIIEMLNELKTV